MTIAPRKLLQKKTEPTEEALPQGIVVGCKGGKHSTTAMIDTGDVHVLMIGAAGVGKTAFWLYPCIEYACASGMSFLSTDTKGDVMRNYGNIAKDYGYMVSVIDLRNPTRSNGNNILYLVNKYTDLYAKHPDQIVYKAKAEKYAKIISKTIILSGMDAASFGQNAYFYDAAEGLLTATILLVAEFCAPEKRHIVSVFKVIQELLAPSKKKGKNQFQQLMELLPNEHKAKWFAGAALNTAEQSMASVMSTALSRLNAFLNTELEQLLCFDTEIDAETFCNRKSAIFVIMPEENPNTFFMISLIIQQLYREILAVADENGGKLKNRCVFFSRDDVQCLPFEALADRSHHPILCPARKELRQGRCGDHRGQYAGHNLRRFRTKQQLGRNTVQGARLSHSHERLGQPFQKRSVTITSNDRATAADTGRTQVLAQGRLYRDENGCASDAGTPQAVLQMRHRIRR